LESLTRSFDQGFDMSDPELSEPAPETPEMAPDTRLDPRVVVRRCGWLSRSKGEQLRECIVRDESAKGARLITGDIQDIPDEFYIYMSLESSSRRHCRVAWRSATEIGVQFIE
jgi:hypothetical protein